MRPDDITLAGWAQAIDTEVCSIQAWCCGCGTPSPELVLEPLTRLASEIRVIARDVQREENEESQAMFARLDAIAAAHTNLEIQTKGKS